MGDVAYGLASLAVGFAVAGSIAHGYQLASGRRLNFTLLICGQRAVALAAVPLLVFAAPFLILRNTLLGTAETEGRAGMVAAATAIAGFWSLMSGSLVAAGWLGIVSRLA